VNKSSKVLRRSSFRIKLGKFYYSFLRYLNWYFISKKFSRTFADKNFSYHVFRHQSVLRRQLRKVDMHLQYNKVDNLKIAIKKINHLVIKPGETFSFWFLVGRTPRWKGYKKGMILQNGEVKSGYGGGLCQLSNLLYWMVLHTPLTVVERHRHSFDVFPDNNRTIPFGCGATVSYNYIDFQFKNNTKLNFQLLLWLTDKELCGDIYSNLPIHNKYEIIETDHIIKPEYGFGYSRHNRIIRKIYNKENNQFLYEELIAENHALLKYNPLLNASNVSL
jgi:vancomycin resistance protein VanW